MGGKTPLGSGANGASLRLDPGIYAAQWRLVYLIAFTPLLARAGPRGGDFVVRRASEPASLIAIVADGNGTVGTEDLAVLVRPRPRPDRAKKSRRLVFGSAARAITFLTLTFMGLSAFGETKVDVATTRFLASDPLDMTITKVNVAGGDYGLGTELDEGLANDVRFRGIKGFASGSRKWSNVDARVTAGANHLANAFPEATEGAVLDQDWTIPVFGAHVGFARERWDVGLDFAHDFVYQDWAQPRAATELLVGNGLTLAGHRDLNPRLIARAHVTGVSLSDGNAQTIGDAEVMMTIIDQRYRLRLGGGAWYDNLAYPKASSYWTPRDAATFTLRSESTVRWSNDVGCVVKINGGYTGEHLHARDLTINLDARLDYALRRDWHLSVGGVRMQNFNPRLASTWLRNDVYASLTAHL